MWQITHKYLADAGLSQSQSLGSLLDLALTILEHPLFTNAIMIGIAGLFIKWRAKKAQIEINNKAAEINFEIQRRYLLTEIKTRKLLEVYPKLHNSVHAAAGPYVSYFTTIANQIDKLRALGKDPDVHQLHQLFEDYWTAVSSKDGFQKVAEIQDLNNDFADASLFISDEITEIVEEMKKEIMNLFQLVRHEIGNGTYKTYSKETLLHLLDRANLSTSLLVQNKSHLAKTMNKELAP